MKAYISKIQFKSGLELALNRDDIVVFVGPNNAGKSQVLQDIDSLCERPSSYNPYYPIVVDDIEISYENLDNALEESLQYGWARRTPDGIKFQGNYYNNEDVIHRHSPNGFGEFKQAYVFKSLPGDNSGLTGMNHYGDNNEYVSYDPVHFIADSKELRDRASNAFCKVYGKDLLAHRMNIESMFFCIGDEATLDRKTEGKVGNDSLDAYKEYMDNLPRLNDQSDGVRGFASIVINLALDHKKIFLLDEPETFIHPPQVQILGSTICEFSENRQVFIATHSQDIIKGLLDSNPKRVRIIRIIREDDSTNRFNVLNNENILGLWKDPFLKYSDILNSMFYENVIVCESDADCKIYGVLLNDIKLEMGLYSQALFLPAYGKQRIFKVVKALKLLGINVISVFDLDVLSDMGELERIIGASGGSIDIIKSDYRTLNQKLQGLSSHIDRKAFKEKVLEIIDQSDDRELSLSEVKKIQKSLEINNKWGYLKKYGYTAIPSGEGIQAYYRIEKYLISLGIYIVRQGELENFIKSISGHGPEWVSKVLEEYPDHSDPVYDEIKSFIKTWEI